FKADFALDGPVPWTAGVCAEASVVHLGDTLGAIARSLTAARAGDPPVAPAMVIGQHSLHDPTRAPAGKHTLYVYTHVPYEPAVDPEAVGDTIESRIEEFAPGFRRLVLARALHAPQDLERLNPSLVRGDILGGSSEPDQQLILRPAPELARYTTPVRGLYLGSASAHPGGGVHGMPGLGAARAALRSRRRGIR
ncbi:MAG TPA: hypothetical protein VHF58_08160, partial [Solirubrobacterales bacterium]|nr:hypothetical protein [Solirubrobacterales bacterium]